MQLWEALEELTLFFQDLPSCVSIEELTENYGLFKLCCNRSWHIQACDANAGTGLEEGLEWLSRQIVATGGHDLAEHFTQ